MWRRARRATCCVMATTTSESLWSVTLNTGRACAPCISLQWSEAGQVVVVTSDAIHILTPSMGHTQQDTTLGTHTSTVLDTKRELANEPAQIESNDEGMVFFI